MVTSISMHLSGHCRDADPFESCCKEVAGLRSWGKLRLLNFPLFCIGV